MGLSKDTRLSSGSGNFEPAEQVLVVSNNAITSKNLEDCACSRYSCSVK